VSENKEVWEIFGREDGENSIVRSVMICTLTKYYPYGQIKEAEMGWVCSRE
jgi:hypothetical protein